MLLYCYPLPPPSCVMVKHGRTVDNQPLFDVVPERDVKIMASFRKRAKRLLCSFSCHRCEDWRQFLFNWIVSLCIMTDSRFPFEDVGFSVTDFRQILVSGSYVAGVAYLISPRRYFLSECVNGVRWFSRFGNCGVDKHLFPYPTRQTADIAFMKTFCTSVDNAALPPQSRVLSRDAWISRDY